MAHHGSGIRSQLNQKSPVWRKTESDRNAMPEVTAGVLVQIPVGRDAFEKADEEENGVRKPAVKFNLKDSLPQNIKGKNSPNLPSLLHSVYIIAITIQEGRNAAWEWNDKNQESRESSTKKRNKSRKARRAHSCKK